MPSTSRQHSPRDLLFFIKVSDLWAGPLALALVGQLLCLGLGMKVMLNISIIDTSTERRLVREAESVSKPKLLAEAQATKQLDRIAPDWPLHLYDGAVIDHILKV